MAPRFPFVRGCDQRSVGDEAARAKDHAKSAKFGEKSVQFDPGTGAPALGAKQRTARGCMPFVAAGGLGEARPGMDGGPLVGVASPEVPGPRASHGEAHEGDAGLVDSVLVADGLDGFHDVCFPGGLVPDALAAEAA